MQEKVTYNYLLCFLQKQMKAYYMAYEGMKECPIEIHQCYSKFEALAEGNQLYRAAHMIIEYTLNDEKKSVCRAIDLVGRYDTSHNVFDNIMKTLGEIVDKACFPLEVDYYVSNPEVRYCKVCSISTSNQETLKLAAGLECLYMMNTDVEVDTYNRLSSVGTRIFENDELIQVLKKRIKETVFDYEWEDYVITSAYQK